jgi:hypothetical protein
MIKSHKNQDHEMSSTQKTERGAGECRLDFLVYCDCSQFEMIPNFTGVQLLSAFWGNSFATREQALPSALVASKLHRGYSDFGAGWLLGFDRFLSVV